MAQGCKASVSASEKPAPGALDAWESAWKTAKGGQRLGAWSCGTSFAQYKRRTRAHQPYPRALGHETLSLALQDNQSGYEPSFTKET